MSMTIKLFWVIFALVLVVSFLALGLVGIPVKSVPVVKTVPSHLIPQ